MKSLFALVAAVVLSVGLVGCSSDSDATVKTGMMGSNYTTVNADVPSTTAAAEAVLREKGLMEVSSSATTVDGQAKGKTATGSEVTVTTRKKDAGTEVDCKVGMGYSELSEEVVLEIKKKLGQ